MLPTLLVAAPSAGERSSTRSSSGANASDEPAAGPPFDEVYRASQRQSERGSSSYESTESDIVMSVAGDEAPHGANGRPTADPGALSHRDVASGHEDLGDRRSIAARLPAVVDVSSAVVAVSTVGDHETSTSYVTPPGTDAARAPHAEPTDIGRVQIATAGTSGSSSVVGDVTNVETAPVPISTVVTEVPRGEHIGTGVGSATEAMTAAMTEAAAHRVRTDLAVESTTQPTDRPAQAPVQSDAATTLLGSSAAPAHDAVGAGASSGAGSATSSSTEGSWPKPPSMAPPIPTATIPPTPTATAPPATIPPATIPPTPSATAPPTSPTGSPDEPGRAVTASVEGGVAAATASPTGPTGASSTVAGPTAGANAGLVPSAGQADTSAVPVGIAASTTNTNIVPGETSSVTASSDTSSTGTIAVLASQHETSSPDHAPSDTSGPVASTPDPTPDPAPDPAPGSASGSSGATADDSVTAETSAPNASTGGASPDASSSPEPGGSGATTRADSAASQQTSQAPTAAGARAAEPSGPVISNGIADHVRHIEQMRQFDLQRLATATRLGVDIVTDELGTVHVDAVDRAGSIHLKLGSDDLGVRTLLADRASELRATLGADGVSIDVGTRGDRPDGDRRPSADGSNGESSGTQGTDGAASSPETAVRATQRATTSSTPTVDGHVDLRI